MRLQRNGDQPELLAWARDLKRGTSLRDQLPEGALWQLHIDRFCKMKFEDIMTPSAP